VNLRNLFPSEMRDIHIWVGGFLCGVLVCLCVISAILWIP